VSTPPATEFSASRGAIDVPRRSNPYVAFATRAGFGLLLVAFLLWRYDARPILQILARERVTFFLATIAIYVAGQTLSSFRWHLLAAKVGVHAPFRDFFAYYFVGVFTNLFVPGTLGGDAARSVYLGRRTHRMGEAVASVVADRGVGLLSLFWVAAAMAMLIPSALAPSVIRATLVVGAVALVIFLAAPLIAMAVPLMPRAARRGIGMLLPYMHHPLSLLAPVALSVVLHLSLGFAQWLIAVGLGLTLPLSIFLLCVPIANLFAGFPITLNGLGVREGAFVVLFGMAGMNRTDAIALGLLWFAASLLGGLTGAIAFAVTKFPDKPKQA